MHFLVRCSLFCEYLTKKCILFLSFSELYNVRIRKAEEEIKMLKHLFTPFELKGKTIKNRFVVPAMVTNFCNLDGTATERYIRYHETKAEGGFGLIITEDYAVSPSAKGFTNIPGLWNDEQIEGHKELPERVHKYGAVILAQIYHAGRQTSRALIGEVPYAPSKIPCPFSPDMPHELTKDEIHKIVEEFGDCALRAKKCGFDGVEIHGAHGYLIAEFMSLYTNKRTDEYGGNLMNRLRFPLEIIENIRKKCGEEFIVGFRISGNECVDGGRTLADTCTIAPILEEAGIDLIHITAGVYKSQDTIIPSFYTGHAWIANMAAEVKKVVNIPVISVGRVNDPLTAEQILAAGKADFVAMGRQSLCDPFTPNKAREGKFEEIRTCIGCHQGCVEEHRQNRPIKCILNPVMGREYEISAAPAQPKKKVAVIGAGPAGMEAALIAAQRGHEVRIYEKTEYPGGQFRLAAIPPCKGEIAGYISWQMNELKKYHVEILFNHEVSAEELENENFDEVIVATGAVPAFPPIKGIELPHVVQANDILGGAAEPGVNCVVIGGGQVGSETANHLAVQLKNVSVVEMREELAMEEVISPRWGLLRSLDRNKVNVYTQAKVMEITEKSVRIERQGNIIEIPADTVVVAVGSKSNRRLAEKLKNKKFNLHVIGDADKVSQAGRAVEQGFEIGYRL